MICAYRQARRSYFPALPQFWAGYGIEGLYRPLRTRSLLISADVPKTIKGLRSFIGTFKALSKVVKGCSRIIGPLESLTAGRPSNEKISLSESALNCFNAAKESLKHTSTIHIPFTSQDAPITSGSSQTVPLSLRVLVRPSISPKRIAIAPN